MFKKAANLLTRHPLERIVIVTYTEAKGVEVTNLAHSKKSTEAVKDWLEKNGVSSHAGIETLGGRWQQASDA